MTSSLLEAGKAPFRHGPVAIGRQRLLDLVFSGGRVPVSSGDIDRRAGTTFLMRHLARFVSINDPFDGDRAKQLPRLPAGWLQDRRVP